MKTKVEITHDVYQEPLKKGDIGYIDGYVQGGDGRPYAVVVTKYYVGFSPTHNLKPLGLLGNIHDNPELIK